MEEKNCRHLLAHLSDYIDNSAAAAVCAEIETHLGDCDDCRVIVDTLRQTVNLYRTLPQPDMPTALRQRLYKSLDLEPFLRPDANDG